MTEGFTEKETSTVIGGSDDRKKYYTWYAYYYYVCVERPLHILLYYYYWEHKTCTTCMHMGRRECHRIIFIKNSDKLPKGVYGLYNVIQFLNTYAELTNV